MTLCFCSARTESGSGRLPDQAVFVVRIRRADRPDDGVPRRVLPHLHDVAGALEDGRLVHVLHHDLDAGLVPEGPHGVEARVDVDVFHLDAEAVLTLLLVIQRLKQQTRRSSEFIIYSQPNILTPLF